MSVDLMGMLKNAISKPAMDKIGGMVGLDPTATNKAFDGASGAILGGMMKKSKTQEGIDKIWGVAKQDEGSLFDGLGDLLGNQAATDNLQKQGGSVLDMVFGGERAKTESTVADSLGLSGGIVGKLMSLAGPMLMGIIGRYIKNKALNAVGLGSLLTDQRSHLGNYMPAGLANNLGFDSFLDNAKVTASNTAGSVNRTASNTANQAADSDGGFLKMLIPLLLLIAIGWGLWQFVISPIMNGAKLRDGIANTTGDAGYVDEKGVNDATETTRLESPGPGIDVSKIDVSTLGAAGPVLFTGMEDVNSGFEKVIDDKTPEAANGLAGRISAFRDTLGDMNFDAMEDSAKENATGILDKFASSLEALMEKVPEALQDIIRPAVDGLIEKINSFGG